MCFFVCLFTSIEQDDGSGYRRSLSRAGAALTKPYEGGFPYMFGEGRGAPIIDEVVLCMMVCIIIDQGSHECCRRGLMKRRENAWREGSKDERKAGTKNGKKLMKEGKME